MDDADGLGRLEERLKNYRHKSWEGSAPLTPAAVLVPLIRKPTGLEVLFTLRRDDLGAHPGQVSFPGGRIDPEDVDSWQTATRECHEELGIDPSNVRMIGRLSDCPVITNFLISPWVGEIQVPGPYRPNEAEVESIFTVPLRTLLDPAMHRSALLTGFERNERVHFFHGGPHVIWGATAGILSELLDLIRGDL